ncbi:hypothetical protein HH214_04655 [Mucilaginibacter robiniae]|uniref:Uncharacterized protein n=1 Tax=Mucilaginibacter robiniae TaxID=2728022 RepID=A0A7L5DYM9_9SPHI|nr:hypothetical protein [Mucilaginibacter robiniae]QJD95217.1 hypothetical protein HH214_04655 [Mucilaginibacter robiniae]
MFLLALFKVTSFHDLLETRRISHDTIIIGTEVMDVSSKKRALTGYTLSSFLLSSGVSKPPMDVKASICIIKQMKRALK